MAALDNVNGIEFHHHIEKDVSKPYHSIQAFDGERKVGELNWYTRTGTIQRVEVQGRMGPNGDANGGSYQRRGIATHMYNLGRDLPGKGPFHSNDRTNAGDAWAKAVGGRRPRNVGH